MLNYQELGFKAGLEIHQQLDTHKLFCNCPSITNKKTAPDLKIKRKLRAVAGESGKKDIAAVFEEQKNKTFEYEFYHDCNCLIELDEEPPLDVNPEALEIVLQISLLLKAKIEPKLKIMRKIVVDGSNVSGFQRTVLIATNGNIKTSKGLVRIPTILLEEEAAKKISTKESKITYRLDRLGIPLVEIATSPDIKDPEHAKETAELIGTLLRSTQVKRGLGSIRQDVNLSIKNSPRMEVKGFQDLKSISKVIESEVQRLIKDKPKSGEVRKAESNLTTTFLRPLPGESRFYPETDIKEFRLTKPFLSQIKIPELITEKALKLEKEFNLSPELAKEIIKNKIPFKELVKAYPKLSPKLMAQILIEFPKDLKARYNLNHIYTPNEFKTVLKLTNENLLQKEAILDMLQKIARSQKINLEDYEQIPITKLQTEIKTIFEKDPNLTPNAIMGLIMQKYSGKVNPKTLFELIKNTL